MSYTALYRKFRPSCFEDVKGQEHIVTTLKNQIKANRIGHAYLFCGTRGTGKTTIAKIFAKSVNCHNPIDGSPCGECPSCKAIAEGKSMNVIEIDAASNNGVENIREIINEVEYSPVDAKYKVYIIDEVHMLSIGAFNALLKTLEEPPSYVIFILATTESHKIPITILSRCQRYDFKRISIDTIADRMKELVEKENVQVDADAVRYIAKAADGSMRDGLSLLDQCLAFHYGERLTYDMALDVLGAVDTTVFSELLRYILARDIIGSIELLERIVMQGRELAQFVTDFTWYLRNLMLVKSSDGAVPLDTLDISSERLEALREEACMMELNTIIRYISIFSELTGRLRYATQKRIMIEMTLIKLMTPQMETDTAAVIDRVRIVEDKLASGAYAAPADANVTASLPTKTADGVQLEKPAIPKAIPDDIKEVVKQWPVIVGLTTEPLHSCIKKAKLSLGEGNVLQICVDNNIMAGVLGQDSKRDELKSVIAEHIGKEVEIDVKTYDRAINFSDCFAELSAILGTAEIEKSDE